MKTLCAYMGVMVTVAVITFFMTLPSQAAPISAATLNAISPASVVTDVRCRRVCVRRCWGPWWDRRCGPRCYRRCW